MADINCILWVDTFWLLYFMPLIFVCFACCYFFFSLYIGIHAGRVCSMIISCNIVWNELSCGKKTFPWAVAVSVQHTLPLNSSTIFNSEQLTTASSTRVWFCSCQYQTFYRFYAVGIFKAELVCRLRAGRWDCSFNKIANRRIVVESSLSRLHASVSLWQKKKISPQHKNL